MSGSFSLPSKRQRSGRWSSLLCGAAVLCLVLPANRAQCAPSSDKDASTVVAQWLRLDGAPMETRMGARIDKVVPLKDSTGTVFAYSVHMKPAGFAIVPADDEVEPVLAFSSGTEFNLSEGNPFGAMVLHDVAGRVTMARRDQKPVAPGKTRIRPPHAVRANSKWTLLRDRMPLLDAPSAQDQAIQLTGSGSITDVRVAPFILSQWDQGNAGGDYCYNYYTPGHYVCGCVATAMAQLMRYFQRPTIGVGTASFSIKIDGSSTTRNLRGGDGSGGPYSWADMPLVPDGTITLAQRQAIGALCHDAGVAAHMEYTAGGSGASLNSAVTALTGTFGYSNAKFGGYGDARDISGTNLNAMANPNLDARLPVLLGILRPGSGHAIVCDGYGYNSGTLYHHLNMGWSGNYSAWYNLPTIDSSPAYTTIFACVYNVYTSGVGEVVSGRITNSTGNALSDVVVTATNASGSVVTGTSDSKGIYALVHLQSSSHYWLSASKNGYTFTDQTVDTGTSVNETELCGNVWGNNFVGTLVLSDPSPFEAWARTASSIDLRWNKNPSNDNVLIAWKTNGIFGVPSGIYTPGQSISGGGTVLYAGSGTNVSHTALQGNTVYDYKAWSVDPNTNYSPGTTLSASTFFTYYVNDTSTVADVWCSAVGNDSNSGMAPNTPKATIKSVLDTYDLEPGDSIYVDTGSYVLLNNIVVGMGDQGSPQYPVTVRGSPNGTVIDRNSGTDGAYGILIDHAGYIDLVDLSFTGGYYCVSLNYADTCILSNITVVGAAFYGVYVGFSQNNLFDGFLVRDCAREGIYGFNSHYNRFAHGVVRNNSRYGFSFSHGVSNLVENCTIALNTNRQVSTTDTDSVLLLNNNIMVASGVAQVCVYWSAELYIGDYNDLYAMNGAYVGHCDGNDKVTIADWRTATAQDAHSLSTSLKDRVNPRITNTPV